MQQIKKPFLPIIMILSGVIAGIFISIAMYMLTGFSFFDSIEHKKVIPSGEAQNADVTVLAYTVLGYIRDDDYLALSRVVHPEFGVVFSPSATINLTTDRRFSAEQIAVLDTDSNIYVWGVYNGSGEPIELTPSGYFDKYISAACHLDSAIIGVNQIVRSGNALENITEIFPNVKFVDFHIPGREQFDEYDWRSLRLGFEEYEDSLRLIVITHNAWTD